ncbi:hypothetical protein DACRYDRAFT_76968 [Dacryopinax primogenitus]|uniref:Uncharacterized protein n=1 Tax=Dacryopinax primogenitus (strain DJM 731) TaxID=1858805 RepID=M5G8I5_DACPD|nr:uncharacterized protein DACRYDRAFT_76968 [Dacryopinax primogenitus]EJU04480.1 hypothetical protein DACRYDRAFT_76968 [Dacryopinax primogenitus]
MSRFMARFVRSCDLCNLISYLNPYTTPLTYSQSLLSLSLFEQSGHSFRPSNRTSSSN